MLKKGIEHIEDSQREIEYKIVSKMRCRCCGAPMYNPDEYVQGIDLAMLFNVPYCSQGCAAEDNGYRGDAIF